MHKTTLTDQVDIVIKPPPVTVPLPRDAWLCLRYGLTPAAAKVIAELAWPEAPSWIGGRQ